jgi:hypothetical protein
MKVLFLDVDGVLNRCGMDEKTHRGLNPMLLRFLGDVIEATGCKICISSTWRRLPSCRPRLFSAPDSLCEDVVVGCTPESVGRTEDGIWLATTRGTEIQAWLDEHPEVKRFAIVDDDDDMGHLSPHLVLTDSYVGLTQKHVAELIRRLS